MRCDELYRKMFNLTEKIFENIGEIPVLLVEGNEKCRKEDALDEPRILLFSY